MIKSRRTSLSTSSVILMILFSDADQYREDLSLRKEGDLEEFALKERAEKADKE